MGGIAVAPFAWSEAGVPYALEQLRQLLKQQSSPEETCAMLIEPVLGEGGYVPAPPGFLEGLRQICDENNLLLIVDEVQTGFGRTGKLFAIDGHYGVEPDILIMAKGLASGMPLSAIASRSELTERQAPGTMGGTYAGNILSCASALATLDVIQQEGLVENSAAMGDRLMPQLRALKDSGRYPIKDVRGKGLMVGLEFEAGNPGAAAAVTKACLDNGLMMLGTSSYEAVRFIPPLTVSADELDLGVELFTKALDATFVN